MENIFPNKEQFDTMNVLLASLASQSGGISTKTPKDVQMITRRNLHNKVYAVGDQFSVERETSISAGVGDSTGITSVTVNEETFIKKIGEAHGCIYEATYDGSVWHKENGDNIILSEYGITVSGTPAENDKLVITVTTKNLTYDILDFDKHTPANRSLIHSIALGLHDVFTYGTIPFCPSQLLYYTQNGLPAGKYKFTLDHAAYGGGTQYDGTYMFTLAQAIPADGGFRHTNPIGGRKNSYAQSDVIGNYIQTYGARPKRDVVESNIAVSIWDGTTECTDLGTFTARSRSYYTEDDTANNGKRNFTERNAYGFNRWRDSVYRQWLNSDAKAVPASDTNTVSNWWKPQTVFDRVPGGAKLAGFLHGLDPAFVDALGEIEVKTALCDCDKVDGATYDITIDKVWLQSMTEVFGGTNNGVAEGSQLAYWVGATNDDRIKYEGSTARYWWLRSPNPTYAYHVRHVSTSGVLSNSSAYGAIGVVPACCII